MLAVFTSINRQLSGSGLLKSRMSLRCSGMYKRNFGRMVSGNMYHRQVYRLLCVLKPVVDADADDSHHKHRISMLHGTHFWRLRRVGQGLSTHKYESTF